MAILMIVFVQFRNFKETMFGTRIVFAYSLETDMILGGIIGSI